MDKKVVLKVWIRRLDGMDKKVWMVLIGRFGWYG